MRFSLIGLAILAGCGGGADDDSGTTNATALAAASPYPFSEPTPTALPEGSKDRFAGIYAHTSSRSPSYAVALIDEQGYFWGHNHPFTSTNFTLVGPIGRSERRLMGDFVDVAGAAAPNLKKRVYFTVSGDIIGTSLRLRFVTGQENDPADVPDIKKAYALNKLDGFLPAQTVNPYSTNLVVARGKYLSADKTVGFPKFQITVGKGGKFIGSEGACQFEGALIGTGKHYKKVNLIYGSGCRSDLGKKIAVGTKMIGVLIGSSYPVAGNSRQNCLVMIVKNYSSKGARTTTTHGFGRVLLS